MRVFVPQPTTAQQEASAESVASAPARLAQGRDSRSPVCLQRTVGSPAIQRKSAKDRPDLVGEAVGALAARFGHDFSRIAVHAPRRGGGGARQVTGMPAPLRGGLEALSGVDLSGTRVHRNSPMPARLNALAYTQGQDIHLAPGQDEHLAHEGWHVVQQMQGRVRSNGHAGSVAINDDAGLEREADQMASRVSHRSAGVPDAAPASAGSSQGGGVAQRKIQITGLDDARRKNFLAKINEGSVLKFEMDGSGFLKQVDPAKTSIEVYSKEIAGAIADGQTVKLNLVTKDDANFIDSFATGQVDYDDMKDLPFNMFRIWLLHFVVERFALANYEANKATATAADFATAHQKGHEAQERQMKEWFPKKTIKYKSEGFDASTKVVDASGNGSIDYVFDFTDVKHVFKQPIVGGATKENIISSKIIVVK